jgi:regulator of nucleoside diphosphate kinase
MSGESRFFNAYDINRIRGFLELAVTGGSERYRYLLKLKQSLEDAVILAPEEMPPNVITMNSQVRIKTLASGETMCVSLVFPQEADYGQRKISLLAPLGAALLGRLAGEAVCYQAPGGSIRILIEEIVYQPEAAREYSV